MKRGTLILALLACLGLFGCQPEPEAPSTPRTATIEEGRDVQLILMQQLESGRQDEGDQVSLLVTEDVRNAAGTLIIPRGSIAVGLVAQSRRADTLSSLTNRPARLAITINEVRTPSGDAIPLQFQGNEDEAEGLWSFTRANTGRTRMSQRVDELSKTEEGRQLLDKVVEIFEDPTALNDPREAEVMLRVVEELDLPRTSELIRDRRLHEVDNLLQRLQSGRGIAEVAAGEMAGLGAIMELANVAGEVGGRVGGMLKGRNITAYIGTPLKAKVAQDTVVKVN